MRAMSVHQAADRPKASLLVSWRLLVALLVLLVAAACAPSAADPGRAVVQQLNQPLSFYPMETGAQVAYVRDGAPLDAARAVETIQGPAVLGGDVWIVFHLVGMGQDLSHFRQFRDDGVYLRRQVRPGCTFDFDPPLHEMPAQHDLRVGAIWSGSTEITQVCPQAPTNQRQQLHSVDYVYTVVDQRPVTLVGRRFDIYAIDRTSRTFDEDGAVAEEISQQVWFAPHVGYVRDERGWLLIDTNFPAGTRVD